MTRILIVDDHEDHRYYLRVLLESHGYAVEQATQGAEALAIARDKTPDLVISDLLMPVMDGYTLLQEWRADESLALIPFIVFTATYTDAADERLALDLGAGAFVRKPCSADNLVAAVKEVLDAPPRTLHAVPSTGSGERGILKHYNDILIRKLEKKTEELELINRALERDLGERKRIQEELSFNNMLLRTQQETSLDAILVVGKNDHVLSYNQRFVELWGIPEDVVSKRDDSPVLHMGAGIVEEPEAFVDLVRQLYKQRDRKSHDEIRFKDGRIIDRYSSPINDPEGNYFGRVWYFRDITERKRYEKQLREQSDLLRQVSAMAQVGGWELDPATGEGTWTEELARIHDVDPSFIPRLSAGIEFYHGESRKIIEQAVHEAIEHATPYDLELEILSAAGELKCVRTMCEPVLRDGKVVMLRGAMQDITLRKTYEARIARLNRVLSLLSHINQLIVRVNSREELFTEACRIATEEGGLSMAMIAVVDEATGQVIPAASMGKDQALMDKVSNILSSENSKQTMVSRAISGKNPMISNETQQDPQLAFGKDYIERGINSLAVLPLIIDDRAMGIFALYAQEPHFFHQEEMELLTEMTDDIAFAIDHVDKQERINYLSFYDELTGLANHRLFLDRVTQDIRASHHGRYKLAVGMVDIERFKIINDSLGRAAGDALLRQVAEWLIQEMGDANLVARVASDHFLIIATEIDSRARLEKEIAKRILAFMEHPFLLKKDAVYRLGIKVGVAIYPEHGTDADTLFKKAEVALKTAKKRGDRYLFYSRQMDEKVADKLSMENQLRQAIDNEEFVLHYQPKAYLESGEVSGAEALIRWNKPDTGLVSPNVFIQILEETGLIYEVGRWAMRKAVTDYLGWRAAGLDVVRVSVNVSPLQLRKSDFIKDIERKAGIGVYAAEGLELELTESSIMENIEANIDTLRAIRELGIRVTIDDFGTGFSSLSYLSRLPLDVLKIDRQFILGMTTDPRGLALVSTIINLAHSLKLKVVAEGVETEEQLRMLRLLQCDEMQGFIFGKPVPADAFASMYLKPKGGK